MGNNSPSVGHPSVASTEGDGSSVKDVYQHVKHSIVKRLPVVAGSTVLPRRRFARESGGEKSPSSLESFRKPHPSSSVVTVQYPIFGAKCNHKVFLNPEILEYFIPFVMDGSLTTMMTVCPHWFITVYDFIVEKWGDNIVKGFKQKYEKYLLLEGVSMSIQPVYTDFLSVRCDLLIYASVLPSAKKQCLELSYAGIYSKPPSRQQQQQTKWSQQQQQDSRLTSGAFRFEVLKPASTRTVWLKKDNSTSHGDEILVAETANVPEACVGDNIELPFNLSNALGIIDPLSVQWFDPKFVTNRDLPPRSFGCKTAYDTDNLMWYDRDNFYSRGVDRIRKLDMFVPQWTLAATHYTGVDIIVTRSKFNVATTGEVREAQQLLGIRFRVFPKNATITVPLKRLGLEHDRFSQVHLRVGDTVVLYTTIGGPPPDY